MSQMQYWRALSFFLFIAALMPSAGSAADGQTQAQLAVAQIEKLVAKVQGGLSGKSLLSGSRKFYVVKIHSVETAIYDVQETRSLISPYTAFIKIRVLVSSNIQSPRADNLDNVLGRTGFTSKALALNSQAPSDFSEATNHQEVTARYAFQNGQWVLKSIMGGDFIYTMVEDNRSILQLFLPES